MLLIQPQLHCNSNRLSAKAFGGHKPLVDAASRPTRGTPEECANVVPASIRSIPSEDQTACGHLT